MLLPDDEQRRGILPTDMKTGGHHSVSPLWPFGPLFIHLLELSRRKRQKLSADPLHLKALLPPLLGLGGPGDCIGDPVLVAFRFGAECHQDVVPLGFAQAVVLDEVRDDCLWASDFDFGRLPKDGDHLSEPSEEFGHGSPNGEVYRLVEPLLTVAQMHLSGDQILDHHPVGAEDPEDPRLQPEGLVARLGVGEEEPADNPIVPVPDEVLEPAALDLDVHLGLGEKAVLDFGPVSLKLVEGAVEHVQVVDHPVAVTQERPDGTAETSDEEVLAILAEPDVDVVRQKLGVLLLHSVVILGRDLQPVGYLVVAGSGHLKRRFFAPKGEPRLTLCHDHLQIGRGYLLVPLLRLLCFEVFEKLLDLHGFLLPWLVVSEKELSSSSVGGMRRTMKTGGIDGGGKKSAHFSPNFLCNPYLHFVIISHSYDPSLQHREWK